ncbi:YcnI family protein [Deinococcus sp. Marseille-Q6407]|uniref:YcnI family copper-binding membrane protein n=1 Tax=Deinococcus sp. Marseille-Q6407 TaxID=2969223 RepID=UPI0021BF5049|nr:DUF1775 domain-containing protein [Deinococcus sp. Marseille-Q6407]
MKRTLTLLSLAVLSAGSALAHTSLQVQSAPAGSIYRGVLQVPHGCGAAATRTVRVRIPQEMYGVKPMPKPGWSLKTVSDDQGVREIVWSGGNLPSEWYDEFVFRGALDPDLKPGTALYFPAVQECRGSRAEWTDTSGHEDAEFPAPRLTVTAAPAAPAGHHH